MAYKNLILLCALLAAGSQTVLGQDNQDAGDQAETAEEHTWKTGPIDWEKHDYDEQEYFKDIPDYIDIKKK